MPKKLITAGLVAALAFSVPSVATAQSSFPALSSSSGTSSDATSRSKVQQVEDKFAAALTAQGHTRHTQHDRAAEKALQAAVDGNVAFTMEPNANFPGASTGQTVSDGYINIYIRFPLEHIDTVLRNIDNATGIAPAPGISLPFGVAVDESQSLVYIAFVIPVSAAF